MKVHESYDNGDAERRLEQLLGLSDAGGEKTAATRRRDDAGGPGLDFSFIFFSDQGKTDGRDKYRLVFDIAGYADPHGFKAVWVPERHFHPFGGIYPSPSVLGAALAVMTENIRIRAGSVVVPLHHPAQVAEEWAVVDNLSNGRVDLGVASGWNPKDFVMAPDNFSDLRRIWHEGTEVIRRLWRGESVEFANGKQEQAAINIYPRPLQPELEIWLTVSRSEESFLYAGRHGYNILTMLAGISVEALGERIALYHKALRENGHDPDTRAVTLMLHTFIHGDLDYVHQHVRRPFLDYIKSSLDSHVGAGLVDIEDEAQREQEMEKLAEYSYERYFRTGALFGTPDSVRDMVAQVMNAGVTEVACLVDFGAAHDAVMSSLPYLNQVREASRLRLR